MFIYSIYIYLFWNEIFSNNTRHEQKHNTLDKRYQSNRLYNNTIHHSLTTTESTEPLSHWASDNSYFQYFRHSSYLEVGVGRGGGLCQGCLREGRESLENIVKIIIFKLTKLNWTCNFKFQINNYN